MKHRAVTRLRSSVPAPFGGFSAPAQPSPEQGRRQPQGRGSSAGSEMRDLRRFGPRSWASAFLSRAGLLHRGRIIVGAAQGPSRRSGGRCRVSRVNAVLWLTCEVPRYEAGRSGRHDEGAARSRDRCHAVHGSFHLVKRTITRQVGDGPFLSQPVADLLGCGEVLYLARRRDDKGQRFAPVDFH